MKLMLRLYFKRIRIEGLEHVPRNQPLLVIPNHQNALLDPLLVGAFIPIDLYFLARSDVFKKRLKPFLNLLHMMPVYRIRDGYASLSQNDATFETCKELFKQNKSVLIFAEGNHGEHHFLRPLTKGAARIALQSQSEMDQALHVLPVGLNFFRHQSPQSAVVIKFGHPIPVKEYLVNYQKHKATGLIAMRDAMAAGMRSTLVVPEETKDYVARRASVFSPENETKSFEELKEIAVSPHPVSYKKSRHLIAKILNPLPFLVLSFVLKRVKDIVFHSSLKFALGLFLFPIWWGIIFLILYLSISIQIATLSLIVMISGLFYSYRHGTDR